MASLRWLLRAQADLQDAVTWYQARSARTASRFEAAVATALERIAVMPEMYGLVDDRHRVCRLAGFPYLIVYRYDAAADEVLVVAITHGSQDPPVWQLLP